MQVGAGVRRSVLGRAVGSIAARAWLTLFLCGALTALALPPLGVWPLLAGFAPLLVLTRRAERPAGAFLLGWWFGLGHFLVGLYWIAIAFFTDAERFGALAVPAVVLLCASLAAFPGFAALALHQLRLRGTGAAILALAVLWTVLEVARGLLFPWNLIGYAWVGTPVAQLAAVTGVHGLSLLSVLAGALPATLAGASDERSFRPLAAGLVVLAAIWAGGTLREGRIQTDTVEGVRLRLVQGNVSQHHKWDPDLRARWFQRHLDLSASGTGQVTHVIWPESATPYSIDQDVLVRQRISDVVPRGGVLITGGERFDLSGEPPRAWNSLFAVDDTGTVLAHYDKHVLVPFGEYLPFRGVLGALGLEKLTRGSIDFQAGPGPVVLDLPGLPPASPLICYEVILSGGVVPEDRRPGWLLNITNDAWFGTSSGPYQHLAMARMRTIEEGLPLVRAANSGISAVVDPLGREVAVLGLNEMGVLDADLPAALPPTWFARLGHLPALVAGVLMVVAAGALERRARGAADRG